MWQTLEPALPAAHPDACQACGRTFMPPLVGEPARQATTEVGGLERRSLILAVLVGPEHYPALLIHRPARIGGVVVAGPVVA